METAVQQQQHLGRDEINVMSDKMLIMLKNSKLIMDRSSHLPTLTQMRGLDVLARLCKAEADDHHNLTMNKNKNEIRLGKRANSTELERVWEYDANKFLSKTSLMRPSLRAVWPPAELTPTSNGVHQHKPTNKQLEQYRAILEVIGTDLQKLKHIKQIHKMRQGGSSSSSARPRTGLEPLAVSKSKMVNELQNGDTPHSDLPDLDVMLIEVVISSPLPLEDKMNFLWDILSEEFDKDDEESLYTEYLQLILSKLEDCPDLKGKSSPRAWEEFIKKLPKINKKVLDHIWNVTKHDKSSILMFEVSQYAKKDIRDQAVNYMLEMGKPTV